MPIISVLPDILINKIAAGEVIERPASIVRELIDNSIDAGAKTISVEALYGGKKLIKVSDDGAGMDRDDALLCFERHATSKIKSEEDLFNITTLGFRGEALSSIASVAKVTLVASSSGSRTGTKVEIGVRQKKEITETPPVQGTTVEIRDIFYNTPARRKFLKSTSTELSHIVDVVTQKALSYPDISFSLKNGGSELISVSAVKDIKERFRQLYGEEILNEFLETEKQAPGIKVYGFLSNPEFARATRGHQYIFINRRAVKNPTVSHAVYNPYRDLIPKDKHPAFFLFLDIDPGRIDVNVHPAKREVRFEAPDLVHEAVESAVREALHRQAGSPNFSEASSPQYGEAGRKHGNYEGQSVRETLTSVFQSSAGFQTDFFTGGASPSISNYFYIGEAFFAEVTNDGLAIIDQHAAHERILYEKFLKKTALEAENLFLPIRVEMPAKEFGIIVNHKKILGGFGIDIEDFGNNNLIVRTIPKELHRVDMKGLLLDVASGIIEAETMGIKGDEEQQKLLQNIASRLACHKSVRGSHQLNSEELSQLVSDLGKTETPDRCPHGRPTRIFLSLDDLRKMFKRK